MKEVGGAGEDGSKQEGRVWKKEFQVFTLHTKNFLHAFLQDDNRYWEISEEILAGATFCTVVSNEVL